MANDYECGERLLFSIFLHVRLKTELDCNIAQRLEEIPPSWRLYAWNAPMGLPIVRKVSWLEAIASTISRLPSQSNATGVDWEGRRAFAWYTPLANKRWLQRDELVRKEWYWLSIARGEWR